MLEYMRISNIWLNKKDMNWSYLDLMNNEELRMNNLGLLSLYIYLSKSMFLPTNSSREILNKSANCTKV